MLFIPIIPLYNAIKSPLTLLLSKDSILSFFQSFLICQSCQAGDHPCCYSLYPLYFPDLFFLCGDHNTAAYSSLRQIVIAKKIFYIMSSSKYVSADMTIISRLYDCMRILLLCWYVSQGRDHLVLPLLNPSLLLLWWWYSCPTCSSRLFSSCFSKIPEICIYLH